MEQSELQRRGAEFTRAMKAFTEAYAAAVSRIAARQVNATMADMRKRRQSA